MTIPERMVNLLNYNEEIISSILKNLVLQDLSNAALVSHTWNKIAKKLKKNTTVVLTVNNYDNVKSANYFKVKCHENPPKSCFTVMDYGVYDRYWYYLENIAGSRKELNKLKKCKNSVVHQHLKACTPDDCDSMLINRPSRCIKYYDCTSTETETLIGYVTLSFPEIPGVQIEPFQMDSAEKRENLVTKAAIQNKEKLKFLIVWAKSDKCFKSIYNLLIDSRKNDFAYCVTICPTVPTLQDGSHDLHYIKGIAFSGDHLHVSTCMYQNQDSIKSLQLPQIPYLKHNTVAFLIYKERKDIGILIQNFSEIFRNTNLLAVESDGLFEIKNDTLEHVSDHVSAAQFIVLAWV